MLKFLVCISISVILSGCNAHNINTQIRVSICLQCVQE